MKKKKKLKRTGVTLDGDGVKCRDDIFNLGAKELGCRAEGIPILTEFTLIFLNGHIPLVTTCELAPLQEVPDRTRSLHLSGRPPSQTGM